MRRWWMCGVVVLGVVAPVAARGARPDKAAQAAVKKVVETHVSQLGADDEPPVDPCAPGAVFSYTVNGDEVLVGGAALRESFRRLSSVGEPAFSRKLKNLKIAVSGDGTAAWVAFELDVNVEENGGEWDYPVRATELLGKIGDDWRILAGALSVGRPDKEVHARALKGELGAPEPVAVGGSDVAPGSLAPDFRCHMTRCREELAGGTWISERADLHVVGSGPKQKVVGGKKFRKAWKAWEGTVSVVGQVRGGTAGGGDVGWVMANVSVAKKKGQVEYAIPFRVLFVYEREADGAWRAVAGHLAVP